MDIYIEINEETTVSDLTEYSKAILKNFKDGETFIMKDLFPGFIWNRLKVSTRRLLGLQFHVFVASLPNEQILVLDKNSSNQQVYKFTGKYKYYDEKFFTATYGKVSSIMMRNSNIESIDKLKDILDGSSIASTLLGNYSEVTERKGYALKTDFKLYLELYKNIKELDCNRLYTNKYVDEYATYLDLPELEDDDIASLNKILDEINNK